MELKVNSISKSYKRQQVLKNITFTASGGELIGFIGANGCGKTTLLKILVGVENADSGKISINGKSVRNLASAKMRRIGYVPQINPLPDKLNVMDCLKLWCGSRQAAEEMLENYDLTEFRKKRIEQLSGGMKRRTAIACAMADKPEILIMDEPTAALDIKYKSVIHQDMMDFVEKGGLLIMVTHEKEEIDMCSRCFEIASGELKAYDQT